MSFEYYIIAVDDCFATADIKAAFASHTQSIDNRITPGHYRLRVEYDTLNHCEVAFDDNNHQTGSFCVHRPCGDKQLFDALFTLMQPKIAFLIYPGDDLNIAVANAQSAIKIPQKYPEFTNKITVLSSAQALYEHLIFN